MRKQSAVHVFSTAGLPVRLLALAVIAAAAGAFFLFQKDDASSADTAWVKESEAGHGSNEAEDDGIGPSVCEGVAGIIFGTDPGWTRVGASSNPDTPFVEVRGQVLDPNMTGKTNPFITHTDNPFNHHSMDVNAFLTLDPDYRHTLSLGNFEEGDANEHGMLEIEWERGGIPVWAFPSEGDRMTIWGVHIWDCGHGDTWLGGDNTYRTEIHPVVGWVNYRDTADRDGEPDSEAKRTRDWKWYDSGDLVGSAAAFPNNGFGDTPLQATIADAYFSSFGGAAVESVNGCDSDDGDVTCFDEGRGGFGENEWQNFLLNQDYTFFVPAPPKPFGAPDDVDMIWEFEDRCSLIPSNPGNPPFDDIDDVGEASDTAEDIGSATCNPVADTVIETTDAYGHPGIEVTVNATDASYPSNGWIAFAKRYKVGWAFVPDAAHRAHKFRVDFNTLGVWNDAEPCGEDGEWNLSIRANESWIHPVEGSGDDGDHFFESGAVDDNLCGGSGDRLDYSIGASVETSVPAGEPINIWSRGFDVDTFANDILPVLDENRTGAGSFESARVSNSDGDYQILYTIVDLTPPAITNLEASDPWAAGMVGHLTGIIDNPCTQGPTVLTVDWGDGNPPEVFNFGSEASIPFDVTHTYFEKGEYEVNLTVANSCGEGKAKITVEVVAILYLSLTGQHNFGSFTANDEDVVYYDGHEFSLVFDGSDVGLSAGIDGLAVIDDDSFLLSFGQNFNLPPVGVIADADIVRFDAVSLGATTAGVFSLYFDGSDVGLSTSSEDVDAIEWNGSVLLLSTGGNFSVPGLNGLDEDIFACTVASTGANTSCTGPLALVWDAGDAGVGLIGSSEDISGLYLLNNLLYLSTSGDFAVIGFPNGKNEDAIFCQNFVSGANSSCGTYWDYFDGTPIFPANAIGAMDFPP
jgi:hypothetical protein